MHARMLIALCATTVTGFFPVGVSAFETRVCITSSHAIGGNRCTIEPHHSTDHVGLMTHVPPITTRDTIMSVSSQAGRLHAHAYGLAENFDPEIQTAGGDTSARFTDRLTINANVPAGTLGYFDARLRVSGALLASQYNVSNAPAMGYCTSGVVASLWIGGESETYSQTVTSPQHLNLPVTETVTVRYEFQFGRPFHIDGFLEVRATAAGNHSGGSALCRASFGNSAYWGGVSEVFLVEGDEPVIDFAIVSDSGVDYLTDFSLDPLFRSDFE